MNKCKIIDIIFPASSPSTKGLEATKKYIEKLGFEPRIFGEEDLIPIETEIMMPIYNEEFRFNQLYNALKAKDSEIVWCYRGGYGCGDLMQELRKSHKLPQGNKKLIGYSDITFLTNFLQKEWGWNNLIYGPMGKEVTLLRNDLSDAAEEGICDIIRGTQTDVSIELDVLNRCEFCNPNDSENFVKEEVNGIIVGGCLSMTIASMGTKNECDWNDKILFMEDIDENDFRLDRMLKHIIDIIVEKNSVPRAIILGNFSEVESEEVSNRGATTMEKIKEPINNFIRRLNENNIFIPVLESNKLGHGKYVKPLPIGNECKIVLSEHSAVLTSSLV